MYKIIVILFCSNLLLFNSCSPKLFIVEGRHIKTLPDSVFTKKNLRYLKITETDIDSLSERIGKLKATIPRDLKRRPFQI